MIGAFHSTATVAELEEVFGTGYPPDHTVQLSERPYPAMQTSEPQIYEPPDNPTTIQETVGIGIALVVLAAGLIAILRRKRRARQ